MPEPRQIEQQDGVALVEHCARFAEAHGIDHMLDLIAGVHQAYAPLCTSAAVKAAYEIAGIDLVPDAEPIQQHLASPSSARPSSPQHHLGIANGQRADLFV